MSTAGDESFLARWSRLKREARTGPSGDAPQHPQAQPPGATGPSPAAGASEARAGESPKERVPVLPPLEELAPDSDFAPFMRAKIDEALRRAALKKLFSDPHFNVPDPWEAYSIDFTQAEPVPPEMLKELAHARRLLFADEESQPSGLAQREEATAHEPSESGGIAHESATEQGAKEAKGEASDAASGKDAQTV